MSTPLPPANLLCGLSQHCCVQMGKLRPEGSSDLLRATLVVGGRAGPKSFGSSRFKVCVACSVPWEGLAQARNVSPTALL